MTPTVPEMATPFRTTTPSTPALMTVTAKQANPVHVSTWGMQNTSQNGPPAPMHMSTSHCNRFWNPETC